MTAKEHGCIICGDEQYLTNPFRYDLCMFHTDRAREAVLCSGGIDMEIFLINNGIDVERLKEAENVSN